MRSDRTSAFPSVAVIPHPSAFEEVDTVYDIQSGRADGTKFFLQ